MANYKNKGRQDGNGLIKAFIAILVALLLALGVCCCGYASRDDAGAWFKNGDLTTWHWSDKTPSDGEEDNNNPATGKKYVDGMTTTVTSANKMRLASRAMTASATARTDSRYMLTATIDPADADEQTLLWDVAFKDPASEWANGKTVTDYVTVTPTSDTKNANVNCLAPFGEQIIVTVTSADNPEAYATCTCDYVMRAQSLVFEFGEGGFDNISYTYSVEGTAHTIESELQISSMTIKPTASNFSEGGEFASRLRSKAEPLFIAEWGKWGETEGEYRANRICEREVNLLINQTDKTVSIPGGKGSALFYVEDYSDEDWSVIWTESEKVRAGELIDQAFRQAVRDYDKNHAVVKVSYTLTYNGENYGEGTIDTYFNFNYQTIKVGVNGVSLDMSGIIF